MDREASDENLIFGRRPVLEALRTDQPIQRLYFQKGVQGGSVEELFDLAKKQRLPFDLKEKAFLDQLTAAGNHQGVIAVRAAGAYSDYLALLRELDPSSAFLVALDHVQDPQNLGAIIRSACAVGADGILIPKRGAAGLSGGAAKAAAGTAEILPVCRVGNLVQSLQKARKAGLWIVGLDPSADTPFTEVDYRAGCAIVVGSEAAGLRRLVRETCDVLVTIPISGRVASLNASVACALVLYEAFRQRRRGPA